MGRNAVLSPDVQPCWGQDACLTDFDVVSRESQHSFPKQQSFQNQVRDPGCALPAVKTGRDVWNVEVKAVI